MTSSQNNINEELLKRLSEQLLPLGRIAVALSGGVDSSVLVGAAAEILGAINVLAVTVAAPLVPAADHSDASEAACNAGVEHMIIHTGDELLDNFVFRENPPDRCYHCKQLIFNEIFNAAQARGIQYVCDGTNVDDLQQYRPGLKALKEMGVISPLAAAGLTKDDVRELAKTYAPNVAVKPSMACLATRIPHGVAITKEALDRIDKAESRLRAEGFGQLRVRDHQGLARVELPAALLKDGLSADRIQLLSRILHESGFTYATIDLDGYRTGSMEVHV